MTEQIFIKEGTELIKSMAKGLVDMNDNIDVQISTGSSHTIVFTLKCAKSDLGKLIGKRGRTATAMRTILGAIASKYGRRAILDIAE
jgi:predicted RNA-binding protein YlqC (UPF0109 family)